MQPVVGRSGCGTEGLLADIAEIASPPTLTCIVERMFADITLAELAVERTFRIHTAAIFDGLALH